MTRIIDTFARPCAMSPHAIERFRERWLPMETEESASMTLGLLFRHAEVVQVESATQALWRVRPRNAVSDILLVVDRDGLVKTVLPPNATREDPATADTVRRLAKANAELGVLVVELQAELLRLRGAG